MQKKDNIPARTLEHTEQGNIEALAAHISAVLNHPATPADIYNALADAVNGLDAPRGFFSSAEYIESCLRVNDEANRKGGAR